MPCYVYKCGQDHVTEKFVTKYDPAKRIICPKCQNPAKRFMSGERINTDMIGNERWSEAMGVAVEQIPEARKTFPGSEYHPETGALKVTSRKDKLLKMKERGYTEY